MLTSSSSRLASTPSTEREGADRTFTLPPGQDALIEAVAAINPRTIVTLTGGGGMDTSRWLDKVPVLLHIWYPGQEGGTAVAQILFGQHDPEGKLPVSFDRSWDDNPSSKWYYGDPERQHHAQHHRRRRPAQGLHHRAHQIRRQADGRLSLLDYHRQASALSVWFRLELHHFQVFQPQSSRYGRARFHGHRRASTSPTPAAWPEPKSPSSTSPILPRKSTARSAN